MRINHNFFLDLAFQIAEKNMGRTGPNPSVGSIVVKNKTVILSTAHPAKFPNVFEKINKEISHIPNSIRNVLYKKEIANKLNASKKEIFSFIEQNN